ncbi:hypothetical protein ACIP5Y_25125 [Nocardia sp. NPDC088792]|uniref:hypothetical protein n=1 Tax=Nocardia sp. NPDC088792 TaxID=3364332 RepID=UPI0037FE1D73
MTTPEEPGISPVAQSGMCYIEIGGNYLQHSDGTWSVVGADGWPTPLETYLAQPAELETDLSTLAPLGVTVINVEPESVRDVPVRRELE